jgi:hypothetical protein
MNEIFYGDKMMKKVESIKNGRKNSLEYPKQGT